MELTLDNLDEIHKLLTNSSQSATYAMKAIDFLGQVDPSPEKRKSINLMMDSVSRYLLEISHIDSFLQACDASNHPITASQQKIYHRMSTNVPASKKICRASY